MWEKLKNKYIEHMFFFVFRKKARHIHIHLSKFLSSEVSIRHIRLLFTSNRAGSSIGRLSLKKIVNDTIIIVCILSYNSSKI